MELLNPQHLADLMAAHPHYVAVLLFTIVFLEALIAVGYLIPAATVLFSAGALMAAGTISPQAAVLGASLGAAAGSTLNYWIGSRFSSRMERIWPFTRYPALLDRNRRFVQRHGGKSVFLGRFTKPLRPTVPAVAGMLGMRFRRFSLFNLSGCLAWAMVYLGAGFLLGSSAEFSPQQTVQLSAFLLTATLLFMMTAMMVRQRRARLAAGRAIDDDS